MAANSDVILHSRAVRERFGGVSDMTLWRWAKKGILPKPIQINGRNYWREVDIVALQEGRAANDSEGGAQ